MVFNGRLNFIQTRVDKLCVTNEKTNTYIKE